MNLYSPVGGGNDAGQLADSATVWFWAFRQNTICAISAASLVLGAGGALGQNQHPRSHHSPNPT